MCAAEQQRPDVAAARQLWQQRQPRLDPTRRVFLDETGTATNMARQRGRARRGQRGEASGARPAGRGQRLIGRVPHGHWKTTTFLAGLRSEGVTAPFVIDRAMNGAIFRAGA